VIVKCADGYVLADAAADALSAAAQQCVNRVHDTFTAELTRGELAERLESSGIPAVPVLRVSEVVNAPQTVARRLILKGTADDDIEWPLLATPIRLALTPAVVKRPIGDAAPDAETILKEWRAATAGAHAPLGAMQESP
jgi:crotonobetainyl-CoA:carnitine CoA-transferase CaiB-like acyl-CoA transferase